MVVTPVDEAGIVLLRGWFRIGVVPKTVNSEIEKKTPVCGDA
jgi:hypothetical protein